MAQLTAGDVITFTVDGVSMTGKVEDASKGDVFSAKLQQVEPQSAIYHVDGVYEFSRDVL